MGGGSQDTTSTTKFELSPEQRWFLDQAKPWFEKFGANPPSVDPRSGIAGFDPLQERGMRMALGAVPGQQRIASAAGAGNEFLSSGRVLYPGSNPALQQHISGATQPIIDQLLQQTMPTLRGGYATGGNMGSSRYQLGAGQATTGAARAVGETTANIANTAYGQGLDAMGRAQALAPNIAQLQALPGMTTEAVGGMRRSMAQAMLSEALSKTREQQMLPASIGREFLAALGAIPGGTQTTQTQQPGPSPLSQIMGGASLFAGVLPFFM